MKDKATLKWIYSHSKSQLLSIVILAIMRCSLTVLGVVFALTSRLVIDAAGAKDMNGLISAGIKLLVIILAQIIIRLVGQAMEAHIGARLRLKLRNKLFTAILKKDYQAATAYHSGDLLARLNDDISVISGGILSLIPSVLALLVGLVYALYSLTRLDRNFAFIFLFVIHIVVGTKKIVINYRASLRAEKLEKKLKDSHTAIMLSQIKPHFLYNVLNTIYHLYKKEPETAQEAISSFAEYLRCNMHSIEKHGLIPFTEEYQHIKTYLSLELIRFQGKLNDVYDVEITNFALPPLTVEPLVENAVKHGVTKKRGGGVVTISTRMTDDGYVVTVSDTGIGFDPDNYMQDDKPHIGIYNVEERLQGMVGGSLSITSTDKGTVAVVTIPKKGGDK